METKVIGTETDGDLCTMMPKAELHAHLNGSVSLNFLKQWSSRKHVPWLNGKVADVERVHGALDLRTVFKLFDLIHKTINCEEAVYEATKSVISEFAADHVKYLELRTTPREEASTGMTDTAYIDAVLRGVRECAQTPDLDIETRLLLAIDRRMTVAQASRVLDLAKQYRSCDGGCIVGIDLSGNPETDATPLLPILRRAKYDRFKLSLHVSEVIANGRETSKLLELLPERIGHATCLLKHDDVEPSQLVNAVTEGSIPIEICLSSNVVCRTVESYDAHHMAFWLGKKHPLVLCTDDKGIFSTCLSKEFAIARSTFRLSSEQLQNLSLNALEYSFAPEHLKNDLGVKWTQFWKQLSTPT